MNGKKTMSVLLAGAMAAGMLAGCGSSSKSGTSSGSTSGSSTKLSMMLSGTESDSFVEGYRKIIDEFNKSNEYGVTIEPEFLNYDGFRCGAGYYLHI